MYLWAQFCFTDKSVFDIPSVYYVHENEVSSITCSASGGVPKPDIEVKFNNITSTEEEKVIIEWHLYSWC